MNPALIPAVTDDGTRIFFNPRKVVVIKYFDEGSSQIFLEGISPIRINSTANDITQRIDEYFHQRNLPVIRIKTTPEGKPL